jgi:hypothetical protein
MRAKKINEDLNDILKPIEKDSEAFIILKKLKNGLSKFEYQVDRNAGRGEKAGLYYIRTFDKPSIIKKSMEDSGIDKYFDLTPVRGGRIYGIRYYIKPEYNNFLKQIFDDWFYERN